jgi:hypothetical protein
VHRAHVVRIASVMALVVTAAWLLTSNVAAYIGQNPYDVHLSGPSGKVSCSRDVVLTASVRDSSSHKAVAHQTVKWDVRQSPSSADRLSRTSTSTASDGKTSVTLSFGSAEGARTIRASVAGFGTNLVVRCSGAARPGPTPTPRVHRPAPHVSHPTRAPHVSRPTTLPPTSTDVPTSGPADSGFNSVLLLLVIGGALGLTVLMRRTTQR